MAIASTESLTIRLSEETNDWLKQHARKLGQSTSEMACALIEEARRVEEFRGIFFRNGGGGRRAVIIGGMDVWEMIMLYQTHGRAGMLEAFNVREHQIDDALAYHEAFPKEIDAILRENSQPMEYWLAKYPELNVEVVKFE
jgi:hypothetical protein